MCVCVCVCVCVFEASIPVLLILSSSPVLSHLSHGYTKPTMMQPQAIRWQPSLTVPSWYCRVSPQIMRAPSPAWWGAWLTTVPPSLSIVRGGRGIPLNYCPPQCWYSIGLFSLCFKEHLYWTWQTASPW